MSSSGKPETSVVMERWASSQVVTPAVPAQVTVQEVTRLLDEPEVFLFMSNLLILKVLDTDFFKQWGIAVGECLLIWDGIRRK